MKADFDFNRIIYRRPRSFQETEIKRFIGVDTESYTDGKPFMICTDSGDIFKPLQVPACFFRRKFKDCHFVTYNLKYDSGSLISFLPDDNKRELWEKNKTLWYEYTITYVPHKNLAFKRGRNKVEFWDIAQYFEMSLDNAAKKYLGEGKTEIETKSFTREYVRRNFKKLSAYCVHDALLTRRLSEFLKDALNRFGVQVTRLYSGAYLSYTYFKARCRIIDVWRYWDKYKDVLRYACEAYQGGKFEVYARGSFTGFEYDIVSAYPYEIANLIDIHKSKVIKSKKYIDEAQYALIRCRLKIDKESPHPVGIQIRGVNIYPMGEYYHTLTKNEFDYMIDEGFDLTILSAFWLVSRVIRYPYRKTVMELYKMKKHYKDKDASLYHVSKVMLNGFYGKFLQLTEKDECLKAGAGWNPIYGAVITANTRLKMCALQKIAGGACLAVHTDSIITENPIPDKLLSGELGGLSLEMSGDGCMIMCGMYDMCDKTAYRGIEFKKDQSWRDVLSKNRGLSVLQFPQLRVISWRQAAAWGLLDKINLFENFPKNINLNADIKRTWFKKVKAGDLLTRLDRSAPRVHVENESPY